MHPCKQKKQKYEAHTLREFLSKLSFYLRYGYFRYAVREIPIGKDLPKVDEKILSNYEVTYQHMKRTRRKEKGLANVIYLRFNHTFILMATSGIHRVFDTIVSYDVRNSPLYFSGYSVGIKDRKPHVIIEPKRFKQIQKKAHAIALHNPGRVTTYLRNMSPFRFAGVNDQRWKLFLEINKRRKVARIERLKWDEVKRIFQGGYASRPAFIAPSTVPSRYPDPGNIHSSGS